MAKPTDTFERFKKICLALPDTRLDIKWGKPHFVVKEKIFAGFGEDEDGAPTMGFKLEMEHQALRIQQPGFRKAKYVGKHGWVSMDAGRIESWDEVADLVLESYRLIAPKRSIAKLPDA